MEVHSGMMFYITKPNSGRVSSDWIYQNYLAASENCQLSDEWLDLRLPMVVEMAKALEDAEIIAVDWERTGI
jgi:uncharacterized protein (UPF0216 family)